MVKRTLETTPALCASYLQALDLHGASLSADAWVTRDAAASHDLLAIVQQQNAILAAQQTSEQDIYGLCHECMEDIAHGDAHAPGCTFPTRKAALDAAKDWVDSPIV